VSYIFVSNIFDISSASFCLMHKICCSFSKFYVLWFKESQKSAVTGGSTAPTILRMVVIIYATLIELYFWMYFRTNTKWTH